MSRADLPADDSRPAPRLQPPTPRVALLIFTAVVIGVLLYLGRHALTPFIVGALLIYVLDPAVDFLARRRIGRWRIPRGLAVLIVYLLTLFIVGEGLALLLGPLISQLRDYVSDLPRLAAALEGTLAELGAAYRALALPPAVREYIDGLLAEFGRGAGRIDFGSLLPIARTILGTVAGFFGFIIIPVWAFYILRDRIRLSEQFDAALPPAWRTDVRAILDIIERVVGRWVRAQILLGLIVGGAIYLGLLLLGNLVDPRFLQFAVLLAVIAGLLELLPIIGPIIAMVPTLLLALATADPLVSIVAVVLLYTAVQQVENAVLVPKIQGDAVELHPSVVIFVLILGGAIAGLPGAIFSVPITAAGRSVYRYLFRRLSDPDARVTTIATAGPTPEEAARSIDEPIADEPDGTGGEPEPTNSHLSQEADVREDGTATQTSHESENDHRSAEHPVQDADGGGERRR
jgi:predicted PurR-regulated permease PerM